MKLHGLTKDALKRIAQVQDSYFNLMDIPLERLVPVEARGNQWIPKIESLVEYMEEEGGWPAELPPICVVEEWTRKPGEEDMYMIINGHHRWRAAEEMGISEIPSRVFSDIQVYDAWAKSVGGNIDK